MLLTFLSSLGVNSALHTRGAKTNIIEKVMFHLDALSVVSFDFGYADRGTDETLTMLCIHDRNTKMMHAVPTPSKGGRSLPFLSAELCRFVTWLGYQEVCLRTDNEPATLSLLEACRKALKGLGVHTTVELIVPGNK